MMSQKHNYLVTISINITNLSKLLLKDVEVEYDAPITMEDIKIIKQNYKKLFSPVEVEIATINIFKFETPAA